MSSLTNKQKRFIDEYLQCWNATEAARRAGYHGNTNTLTTVGSENLTKPNISQIIESRLRESAMSANEVIARLSEYARFDPGPYTRIDDDGGVSLDLAAMRHDGKTHHIKNVYQTAHGARVELHDSQAALGQLFKLHGLGSENVVHTGTVGVASVSADELAAAREKASDWEQERFGDLDGDSGADG